MGDEEERGEIAELRKFLQRRPEWNGASPPLPTTDANSPGKERLKAWTGRQEELVSQIVEQQQLLEKRVKEAFSQLGREVVEARDEIALRAPSPRWRQGNEKGRHSTPA